MDNLPCFRHRCTCIEHIARASSSISQVHQRVMHQPINERVTNLVATRQETTLEQIHKYANTKTQDSPLEQIQKCTNTQIQTTLEPRAMQQAPGSLAEPALLNSLAFSPLIKEEGLGGVQEQESLERGEINPKVEVSDGAPLVCRTCNKVRQDEN